MVKQKSDYDSCSRLAITNEFMYSRHRRRINCSNGQYIRTYSIAYFGWHLTLLSHYKIFYSFRRSIKIVLCMNNSTAFTWNGNFVFRLCFFSFASLPSKNHLNCGQPNSNSQSIILWNNNNTVIFGICKWFAVS